MAKTVFLILFFSVGIFAQTESDTVVARPLSDTLFTMRKSPWVAVGLSAVLPGAGQVYNESYWKVPVVLGVQGWLLYNFVINHNEYTKYADLYAATKDVRNQKLREFYHDQRDQFGTYMVLTYFLTLVDAYVDSHLFDFTVEESPIGVRPLVQFKYSF